MPDPLPIKQVRLNQKLLAQKENLLVTDNSMALFSSPEHDAGSYMYTYKQYSLEFDLLASLNDSCPVPFCPRDLTN